MRSMAGRVRVETEDARSDEERIVEFERELAALEIEARRRIRSRPSPLASITPGEIAEFAASGVPEVLGRMQPEWRRSSNR